MSLPAASSVTLVPVLIAAPLLVALSGTAGVSVTLAPLAIGAPVLPAAAFGADDADQDQPPSTAGNVVLSAVAIAAPLVPAHTFAAAGTGTPPDDPSTILIDAPIVDEIIVQAPL